MYAPRSTFQYSNLGLTLIGEVVAVTSGMPYAEYMRRHVLEPLGLSSTVPDMLEADRGNRLATGYAALDRRGKRAAVPFFTAKGLAPAAGFVSTAEDLARFAMWQFRLLGKGGEQVLKAAGRLTEVAIMKNHAAQAVRNLVGRVMLGLAPVRRAIAETMTEVSIGYEHSPLNGFSAHGISGPTPGERRGTRPPNKRRWRPIR